METKLLSGERVMLRMKKIIAFMIIVCLSVPFIPIHAAGDEGSYQSKDEVIYATLQPNGHQESMYVVNSFDVNNQGEMTDYGNYTQVKNLTNLTEVKQNKEIISFTAEEDKFYYQGNLENKPLPWDFSISYYLEGEEQSPEEMLGESGHVTIEMDVSANEKVDASFFENYLIQISVELNGELYEEVQAEDGTIANAGKNKQVTYTVMPAQEEQFTLEADVTDFELTGISINAMPSSMAMESPDVGDMKEDMKTLSDATMEMDEGVGELKDGVSDLNSGLSSLESGSADYKDGIVELHSGSADLIDGSQSINNALATVSASLNQEMEAGDFGQLQDGLTQIADGLKETKNGLATLQENYQQAYQALGQSINGIPDHVTDEEIQALIQTLNENEVDTTTVDKLLEAYKASQQAKGTFQQVKEAFDAVSPTLEQVSGSLTEMVTNLEMITNELAAAMDELDIESSVHELQAGITELSTQYNSFHSGLTEYTKGVGELANAYGEVHNGITDLSDGTSSLGDGVSELKDGTAELADSTGEMPEELENEVDRMINEYDKSDFEPVSFVSDKNKKVNSVQFVIQTDSITKEEKEQEEAEETEEEKGIWERLLDLFR